MGPAPVAIVGAGPVGLSLALGLARHGVHSVLLEREAATSEHSKAPGIHVRTREALRQWEAEAALLGAGELRTALVLQRVPAGRPWLTVDFDELAATAHRPGLLILEQGETERLLLEAVRATGACDVRFGAEVTGLASGPERVELEVREEEGTHTLDAAFVVGCDGAGSTVRSSLGLPFDGLTYALRPVLADVAVPDTRDDLPWPRLCNAAGGLTAALRLRPGLWRIIRLERGAPDADADVPDAEVGAHVEAVLGGGPAPVVWSSRFRIHRRSAARFRHGRVLLAGDAAHVHSPVGGQGMNAGIHDAHNLAWKLAAALGGGDVDRLLDSYDVERRAVVVGSVTRSTDLATRVFLQAPAPLRRAAFATLRVALVVPPVRRRALRRMTMIDLAYPASPLLRDADRAAGVRLPDPLLRAPGGARVRLHALLGTGPALLCLAVPRPSELGEGVRALRIGPGGHHDPTGALRRLLGRRRGWILVRPDGHVAWARRRAEGLPPEGLSAATAHALGRRDEAAGAPAQRRGAPLP